MRFRKLAAIPKPTPRNFKSLDNYMSNTKPLVGREAKFITHGEDFLALQDIPEGSYLDELMERVLDKMPCKATRVSIRSISYQNEERLTMIYFHSIYSSQRNRCRKRKTLS
jgi:hypothetical protein